MIYLVCAKCRARISAFLEFTGDNGMWNDYQKRTGEDLVSPGQYFKNPIGNYILNVNDIRNFHYHLDRITGCCGPGEDDEPNLICKCRAEIGREVSDCIYAHYVWLSPSDVLEIHDDWKIFDMIKPALFETGVIIEGVQVLEHCAGF